MDELTAEFVIESREGLDRMERCLTELEGRPHDGALLDEIFRALHTIKGSTGFLGFVRLEALAHAGETLLSSLRNGTIAVTAELISSLLELLDSLRAVLRLIEVTGGEGQRRSDEDGCTISRLVGANEPGNVSAALARVAACSERVVGPSNINAGTSYPGPEPESARHSTEAPAGIERRVTLQPVDRTIRVDVEVLDRLMNQVGELVLTRNQLLRLQPEAEHLDEIARRLDAVTSDLRETVMRMRLQPVGHLFGKFPRLVRDLARACGKQVRLEVEGQDTGLDKSLVEAIRDPLTHALRNAIDHGIETPGARLQAGKTAEGVIRLRAFQQNGRVLIEMHDDGAGICGQKVSAKAVERGLISPARAAALTDCERTQLVFLPGLSTAAEVSSLSGRGVGMDVVRANVEKAGGSVQLETVPGAGATVRLSLPLTVAILPAVVVRLGQQSFAIPQSALLELIYIPPGELASRLERAGELELHRTRVGLVPVVRLAPLLGLPESSAELRHHIALLEAEGCHFGVLVDEAVAPEEIVTKPISALLRRSGFFSGAALLGSGELAMVLDIGGLRAASKPDRHSKCHRTERDPTPEETRMSAAGGEAALAFDALAANHSLGVA